MTARDQGGTQGIELCGYSRDGLVCIHERGHGVPAGENIGRHYLVAAPAGRPADEERESETLVEVLSSADPNPKWAHEQARAVLAAGWKSPAEHERVVREARAEALEQAADQCEADAETCFCGSETCAENNRITATWLRGRAAQHRADKEPT